MSLSNELISQFVKATKDDGSDKQKDSKLFGTIVEYGGDKYVRLDGSDLLTPISTTTDVSNDERVTVEIKNHAAIVTGNLTAPSAKKEDLDDAVDQINNFEIVIADKIDTDEFNAEIGRIDNLISDTITANEGRFEDLEADNLKINEKLTATDAAIENLETTKLDAEIADLTYATIENLDATNANIYNLSAAYGDFKDLTTEKFTAFDAAINDLETNKLSAVDADLKYANIDFSNIGEAAVEELFSKSGIIEDLVVSEGHITGQLVGVTISGDLIEGNTIKADKLVVLGSDGLYYKLNVNAETVAAEQTEYNSLNGSIITANTITAEKINVDDLVAFNATIGGFKITNSAIYSGVKSSIDNSTSGVYLDKDGQISIGNSNQFVTFYKDAETNTYKLAISAGSGNNYIRAYEDENGDFKVQISASQIKLGSGDKDLEESLAETIKSTVEEFYLSDSPTELLNGSWSNTQPTWTEGKYIWRRTKVTYGNNTIDYTPSTTGVCITGNPGSSGKGIQSTEIRYQVSDSQTELPTGAWTETIPNTTTAKPYLWTRTVITYTDDSTSTSYSVSSTMDSIEVGATNLQRNSEFKDQLNYWFITSDEYTQIDGTLTYEGSNVLKFSRPVDDVDGGSIYLQTNYATNSIPGKSGDTFSISAYFYTEDATETNINGPVYLTLWTSDTDGGNDVNVIQKEINFESGKWVREILTGTLTQDAQSVTFVIRMTEDGTFYMARPKLERGNQVTDWSPAPEDLDFSNAIEETNGALEDLDNALTEEIIETRAELEILSNSISTLVVDENGESMMTQTGDGWVFSMGNTITDLNAAKENIDTLGQTVTNHDADIHNIEASIGNLQEITSYIRINSDGDVPFIELGNATSDFKLKITNSDIQFIDGAEMPAHITNQMLKIRTAEIEDELIFGGFAFAERANGNMGLFWKGGN